MCRIYTTPIKCVFFSDYTVPENMIILPQQKGLKFPGAWGFSKTKTCKENVSSSIGILRGLGDGS